jgi:predicted dehydrogenase
VEKPFCLTHEELAEIEAVYAQAASHGNSPVLMVGFNRRFSPLTGMICEKLGKGPMAMMYRVNAGTIPHDSWVQDMEIGGGRVIGEACHFVDLLSFINGSPVVSVYAAAMRDAQDLGDTLTVSMQYANGSLGSIQYFANGSRSVPKEYLEIHCHGLTAILRDFKELDIHGDRKRFRKKLLSQDKGQKAEVGKFLESIIRGEPSPIPAEEIFTTTRVTFKIVESIRTGKAIAV